MISVIIPIYNASNTLNMCLKSIQKQTYKDLEILMIDDGSTDDSAEICKTFANADNRFKYIYQENQGVSVARNNGISNSCGEYLAFCDADDWIDCDMYEFLYDNLIKYKADISICDCYIDYHTKCDLIRNVDNKIYIFDKKQAIAEMHKGNNFAGHLCNKLIKKELTQDTMLPTDISIYEDMVFLWDIFYKSQKSVFQRIKKYHYIQNPISAMHQYRQSFWSVQKACDIMLNSMNSFYPDMVALAQKTVILGNMELAIKLQDAKKLNGENYKKVLQKIRGSYNDSSMAFFSKKYQLQIKIFLKNRFLFIMMRYIKNIIRGLKFWIKKEA